MSDEPPIEDQRQIVQSRAEVADMLALSPRSDFTYKLLENRRFQQSDSRQSLFNGALVRGCEFIEVDLSRCDFEGANFQNCIFKKVKFSNADIRSSWMTRCHFEHCYFDEAYISDCEFNSCDIASSSFQQALLTESSFNGCSLKDNNFQGGTFTLDEFRNSFLENSTLGDCTFVNHLFIGCRFKGIKINADTFGTYFGVKKTDLSNFDLIFLGSNVCAAGEIEDIVDALEQEYSRRGWAYQLAMLHLNFRVHSKISSLEEVISALLMPLSKGLPIKKDDGTFLRNVMRELAMQKALPGYSCFKIIEKIESILDAGSLPALSRDSLRAIALDARDLLQEMLIEFEQRCWNISLVETDIPVTSKFTFDFEPEIKVTEVLNRISALSELSISKRPFLIEERRGSFIECVATTIFAVAALQMLLFLLNGCIFQITEARARFEILFSSKLAPPFKRRALGPARELPKWMMTAMQAMITAVSKGAISTELPNKGFNKDNIKKIQVTSNSIEDSEAKG